MLTLATFWGLVIATALTPAGLASYRHKPRADWIIDTLGLLVQGFVIPVAQVVVVAAALHAWAPELASSVALPGNDFAIGFLLNFVALDYLYYWNHRLMHSAQLWPVHRVHHSVSAMDVFGTSRNTLWTSFLFVYVWANGAAVFLLAEPGGYVAAAALTASLDLWRHSAFAPRAGTRWHRLLSGWLLLPTDHAWHHATGNLQGNFGANLMLWDRLHGTRIARPEPPRELGEPTWMSMTRQLLWPFAR